ncbi:hsp70 nucleotide exchange factor Fes1p [Trichomonascus vanleenenianus]|uniref:Hsp70 nucleotide exchange factor FES1 n=1 Tax=Trichomonascus vanleenenianus TaxID=2268995 RepID=UPI003EC9A982
MEKLLKWSIESASHDPNSGREAPKPDAKLLSQLFGGPDEAQLMQQAVAVAATKENELEDRLVALDNLEMLIENLDNANNLENMQLWPAVLGLLDDESAEIRKMAAWVIGTAVQNNEKSQLSLADKDGAIAKLVKLAAEDKNEEVRLKGVYALSSALGHCQPAYDIFESNSGWKLVSELLEPKEISTKLKMKVLSLIQVSASIDPVKQKHDRVKEHRVIDTLAGILSCGDANLEEKTLHVLCSLKLHEFDFTKEEAELILAQRKRLIDASEGSLSEDDFPF